MVELMETGCRMLKFKWGEPSGPRLRGGVSKDWLVDPCYSLDGEGGDAIYF